MRSRFQTSLCLPFDKLRMYGSMVLPISSVVRFFALRAKKRTTKSTAVPEPVEGLPKAKNAYPVNPVIDA
jgi:hypothetical protein